MNASPRVAGDRASPPPTDGDGSRATEKYIFLYTLSVKKMIGTMMLRHGFDGGALARGFH